MEVEMFLISSLLLLVRVPALEFELTSHISFKSFIELKIIYIILVKLFVTYLP